MTEINFRELMDQEQFSRLMNQLLNKKFGARAIRPPNDMGRDSYVVGENEIAEEIFQYKFFFGSLKSAQKRDIENSLKRALECFPDCKRWTLCLPQEISSKEEDWLFSLKKKYGNAEIDYAGESDIKNWINDTNFPAYNFFPSLIGDKLLSEMKKIKHLCESEKELKLETINKMINYILSNQITGAKEKIEIPAEIDKKIKKNDLSETFKEILKIEVAKFPQIEEYLKSGVLKDFEVNNLLTTLKFIYMEQRTDSKNGDEIFFRMLKKICPNNASEDEIAACASIICYFFTACEVFEK